MAMPTKICDITNMLNLFPYTQLRFASRPQLNTRYHLRWSVSAIYFQRINTFYGIMDYTYSLIMRLAQWSYQPP